MKRTIALTLCLLAAACAHQPSPAPEAPKPCLTEAPPAMQKLGTIDGPRKLTFPGSAEDGQDLQAVGIIVTQESFMKFFGEDLPRLRKWADAAWEKCRAK